MLLFQSYDVHLIVESLARYEDSLQDVRIIPHSMETYTSIMTRKFKLVITIINCLRLIVIITKKLFC